MWYFRFFFLVLFTLNSLSVVAQELPTPMAKKENEARKRTAGELVMLAKWCKSVKAYDHARVELEKALVIYPKHFQAKKNRASLEKLKGKPRSNFSRQFPKKRNAAYRKCAKHIAKAAKYIFSKGHHEHFDRLFKLTSANFPIPEVAQSFGVSWFSPYRQWVHPTTLKRLKAGQELIDNKWVARSEVEKLNQKHSSWESPWVLSDEVHELKTTFPLRKARKVLGHIGHFRRFFLKQFQPDWDLKKPEGKLPVILTKNRREMLEQMGKYSPGNRQEPRGAAFYLYSNRKLNPCFLTLELVGGGGRTTSITIDQLFNPLQHEISHQIAFEYCKHDYDPTVHINYQFWCTEALANYLAFFVLKSGNWYLGRPRTVAFGEGFTESGFAHCQANLSSLPKLEQFFVIPRQQFPTGRNYHMATTLGYFMTEGCGGKYRSHFVKLLEVVHKARSNSKTLDLCFKDIDRKEMQKDWEAFVRNIRLD